jgi:SAM-dependent methyltransferase
VTDRKAWFESRVFRGARGIEIGPLHHPVMDKATHHVLYLDHTTTDELRRKYADDDALRHETDSIVGVDLVWDGTVPLRKVAGEGYDYVVASHVLEHVPDPVGWLGELSSVLVDTGVVLLAIPDKRFCFDVNRSVTEIADLVDCHLRELKAPSPRHIYDFWSKIVAVDDRKVWRGEVDYSDKTRSDVEDPDRDAYERCLAAMATASYSDVHCHVFTPESFLLLFEKLARLELIDFKIASFEPTQVDSLEFFVALEKLGPLEDAGTKLATQLASVPRERGGWPSPAAPGAAGSGASGVVAMDLSQRERAVILQKRRLLGALRRRLSRAPARRPGAW